MSELTFAEKKISVFQEFKVLIYKSCHFVCFKNSRCLFVSHVILDLKFSKILC